MSQKFPLKEDPDDVFVNGQYVIGCGSTSGGVGSIAFVIYQSESGIQWAYDDKRTDKPDDEIQLMPWEKKAELCSWHAKISTPDKVEDGYRVRGRIWPRKQIASTYQSLEEVMDYTEYMEDMFKELKLNIHDFNWDFANSSDKHGFTKWPKVSSSQKIEIPPDIQKRMNDLIQRIHLATPDEKRKIKKELEAIRDKLGFKQSELDKRIKASLEKQAQGEKQYGSVAAANYAKGAIAEVKLRIYNKTLDPKLWDKNKKLNPEVRDALLKIAQDFFNDSQFSSELVDIQMLGSSANYNWSNESDIDLHIIIDIAKEKIHPEYARKFMDAFGKKWNLEHDIEIKGHKVEIYVQDLSEMNSSESSYSIYEDKWVKPPVPHKLHLDREKIKSKYYAIKKKIDTIVDSDNVEGLKALMKSIRAYRQAGLTKSGEYSVENIVFKALRHTGELEKLHNAINTVYDKKMTIKEGIGQPYAITGRVSRDLDVEGIKYTSTSAGEFTSHGDLLKRGHWADSVHWRYRSEGNTIIWNDKPNEDQLDAVKAWLQTKYGVKNPKYMSVSTMNGDQVPKSHYIGMDYTSESKKKISESDEDYLFIGIVTDDLEIRVRKFGPNVKTHGSNEFIGLRSSGSQAFRYRLDLNELFWWGNPNDLQKEEVLHWLKKHLGVTNPKQKSIDGSRYGDVEWYKSHPKGTYESMKEGKFDPFKTKELEFVTYGGLSLTKQKGYDPEKLSQSDKFHTPPARKGIYAFVWPYIEKFLLGGSEFVDPKKRGKNQRQRIQYVKDKEGNPITSDHPDFEKLSDKNKNWTLQREKPNAPEGDDVDYKDKYTNILYNNSARKKFKYNGPIWHHLTEGVPQYAILDQKGSWVKTDMDTFRMMLKKELQGMMKTDRGHGWQTGIGIWAKDHLEVFIDEKI